MMSRIRYAASTAALLMLLPVAAQAQNQVQVQLTAPYAPGGSAVISPNGQYYESPYTAIVGGNTLRVNCVDFFHDVLIGELWTATQVNLGQAASTPSLLLLTRNGNLANALSIYEQVAWLTDQYTPNPATDAAKTVAIQTAIWAIANTVAPNDFLGLNPAQWVGSLDTSPANTNQATTGYWIGQAQTSYAALEGSGFYNKFNILTDVNIANNATCVNDPSHLYTCTAQEFIFSSTPEPGSLVLLATGFVAVVSRVKRRKKGELAAAAVA